MPKRIKIKINNQKISCLPGQTIFEVAKNNDIHIPGLCGHPDFPAKGNCRICVVEVAGCKNLVTACSTQVEDGMVIRTDADRVKKARNLNIELIFAEHIEKCEDCIWRFECKLLGFAEKYKILITRFCDRKKRRKIHKFANAVEIDGTQCIDCRNCIDACSLLQNIHYLELKGRGTNQEVVPTKNKPRTFLRVLPEDTIASEVSKLTSREKVRGKDNHCILCGQCAVHCPVSSAQEQSHWEMVEKILGNKKKMVVAQFAPSIRVSMGEDFGLPYGKIMTEHVVAGLRELGFNHVFDVSFSADVTTMVEAGELLERLALTPSPSPARTSRERGAKEGKLPMFTSCCPSWINYVEFYHPELIPNLTTARSPHIHSGGMIKTYWAKQMNINPKDIVVVSIMPCTSKKYEASRKELKIKGLWPVDYVLTTREFSFMLKKNNINFPELKKSKADSPLGEYSGAGVIYGGSGGVMESALRTAQYLACGNSKNKICHTKLEFRDVRGLEGIKEAVVGVAGKKLRVAVVNGISHIEPVIANLDKYDYIEVMACPGGCIGGGGQPIPTTNEIRAKRIAALYKLDKTLKIRKAHENKGVQVALDWLKGQGYKMEHGVLHTGYKKKRRY